MDYYIFRHAQTYQSKYDIPYGNKLETAKILSEGIPAIKRLANFLKSTDTDINYSSPFTRCRQTVKIVSKITNKKFIYDYRLRDYTREKESISQLIDRLKGFLYEVNSKELKAVLICTHGYPISGLTHLILLGRVTRSQLDSYPKTGVLTIISDNKMKTLNFNNL